MSQRYIGYLGWSVLAISVVGLFVLPAPWSSYSGVVTGVWVATCVAYSVSKDSTKPIGALLRNVLIAAVALGCLSLVREGQPSYDEDGEVVAEGYEATLADRAAAGVRMSAKALLGGLLGVTTAILYRDKRRRTDGAR